MRIIRFILLCCICSTTATADLIADGKRATAYFDTSFKGAPAYCVHSNGLFATSVVALPPEQPTRNGQPLTITVFPGEPGQETLRAKVVYRNGKHGIALLQLESLPATPLTALPLGSESDITEGGVLHAFSFPVDRANPARNVYPPIEHTAGRVKRLTKTGYPQALHLFYADLPLERSAEGAPVLNADGKVIGMASGRDQEGGRVGGVQALKALLATPQISFLPEPILQASAGDPRSFKIGVLAAADVAKELQVTLELDDLSPGGPAVFTAKTENGVDFTVTAPPVKSTSSRERLAGVRYRVRVHQARKLVAESEGTIPVVDAPATRPAVDQPFVLKLPSPIGDVCLGGGGRYLIASMPALNTLAVIDLPARKIARYITPPDRLAQFTASRDSLITIAPTKQLIQRWDLETGKLSLAKPLDLPVNSMPSAVHVGFASDGPMILWWNSGRDIVAGRMSILDLAGLNDTGLKVVAAMPHAFDVNNRVRASADGKTFATWNTGSDPSGMTQYRILEKKVKIRSLGENNGSILPSPDGGEFHTEVGVFDANTIDLRQRVERDRRAGRSLRIPACDGPFSLVIPMELGRRGLQLTPGGMVHARGASRGVIAAPRLTEMAGTPVDPWLKSDFLADKRIVFHPSANLLATIPDSNDQIVIRTFDIPALLKASDVDFLLVNSVPPATVRRGATYSHQLTALSRHDAVTYRLKQGPEGLKLTPEGLLTWPVPADVWVPPHNEVLIGVSDASGQTVQHRISISIE